VSAEVTADGQALAPFMGEWQQAKHRRNSRDVGQTPNPASSQPVN